MSTEPAAAFEHTREEREQMLSGVESMVKAAARKVGSRVERWTHEDREDFIQDVKVMLWKCSTRYDKSRGVKWSSYAYSIIDRATKDAVARAAGQLEINVDDRDWDQLARKLCTKPDDAEPVEVEPVEAEETASTLVDAVHHQLIQGFLVRLGPGHRRLVERVLFEHLTCDQIAEQDGHPVKVVRTNLKQALRHLAASGLLAHVATDAKVAAVTAPRNPVKKNAAERWLVKVQGELQRLATTPVYQDRLRQVGTLELAAALELFRCDGLTLPVASELLGRTERGVKLDVGAALKVLAA